MVTLFEITIRRNESEEISQSSVETRIDPCDNIQIITLPVGPLHSGKLMRATVGILPKNAIIPDDYLENGDKEPLAVGLAQAHWGYVFLPSPTL